MSLLTAIPFFMRPMARWQSIQRELDAYARGHGYPTYTESPKQYRFHGWGLLHLRAACNVDYLPLAGAAPVPLPRRFSGAGFDDPLTAPHAIAPPTNSQYPDW